MLTLVDLLHLSGTPGVGAAGTAVVKLYETVDTVKVHKQRCKFIRNQCVETLNQLKESNSYLEGSAEMKEAIDLFENKVLKIHKKMQEWGQLSMMKSVIRQSEISMGLDNLNTELTYCISRFQIAGTADIQRSQQEARLIYDRDQAELREQLLSVVRQQENMNNLLTNNSDVQQMMQTLQEEIQHQDVQPPTKGHERERERDKRDLQETLYYLSKETDVLPPMGDLTHEVQKTSEHAVAHGADNDIYTGLWLGQERVALKFTRGCNHSETARKKFYKEVAIWRNLHHPNIVRLYGTATFGEYIYTVSPWMDKGDAAHFLHDNPEHDRKQLVLEVAQGLTYLHNHGVAHGDLRCANILISKNGVARISDFGLSILVGDIAEESGVHSNAQDANLGSLRWRAPELIDPPADTRPVITPATDVWSFGMLSLETVTGQRPYFELGLNDIAVMRAITRGSLPNMPSQGPAGELIRFLEEIMFSCWQLAPEDRPSMQQVLNRLRQKMGSGTGAGAVTGEPLSGSPRSSPMLSPAPLPSPEEHGHHARAPLLNAQPPRPSGPRLAPSKMLPLRQTVSHNQQASGVATATSPDRSETLLFGNYKRPHAASTSRLVPLSPMSPPTSSPITRFPSRPSPPPPLTPPKSTGSSGTSGSSSIFSPPPPSVIPASPSNPRPPYHRLSTSTTSTSNSISPPLRAGSNSFSLSITPPSDHSLHRHMAQVNMQDTLRQDSMRRDTLSSSDRTPVPNGAASIRSYSSYSPDHAVLRYDDVDLRYDANGTVLIGTLPALIRRLLTSTDSLDQDIQFRDTFLACYPAFTSAEDLFQAMEQSYRASELGDVAGYGTPVEGCTTVLILMRLWLQYHRAFQRDIALLQNMRNFAESIASPNTVKRYADQLLDVIRSKMSELERPRRFSKAHSTKVYTGFKASTALPRDFAIGFTILAWDIYSDLVRADFIASVMGAPGREYIENYLTTWDKISQWTRSMILQNDHSKVRTARLSLFITIAHECRLLRNFMCMAAIGSACSSPWITRLRYTYGDLEKGHKDALKTITDLVDSHDNFKNYRAELVTLSKHKKPLIPDLVINIRDLKSLWTRTSPNVREAGQDFVNFKKYNAITDQIKLILSHQHPVIDLERSRETGALAYLECQLDAFTISDESKTSFEGRALQLAKDEERAYVSREREVREAGFGRAKKTSKR